MAGKTVRSLVAVIGLVIFLAGLWGSVTIKVFVLAVCSCAALAAVDVNYSLRECYLTHLPSRRCPGNCLGLIMGRRYNGQINVNFFAFERDRSVALFEKCFLKVQPAALV